MYDYGLSVLEQYGLTASSSGRVRGALLCRTEKGPVILREFHGSEKKLAMQQELLKKLRDEGFTVDVFLENQDGTLVSRDKDSVPYTAQVWFDGRECDTKSEADIRKSIRTLAELHRKMQLPLKKDYAGRDQRDEYIRHNQELRKIHRFIRKKGASNPFEKDYLQSVEGFLEKGEEAVSMLETTDYERLRKKALSEGYVCHGEFNQHNVLICGRNTAVSNFGHWSFDVQMADLYRFMRKILEKYSWDIYMAEKMLSAYNAVRPISGSEWQNLKVRFLYPEKYWKLANHYYTHNKVVVSGKNVEKLRIMISQKEQWEHFWGQCFRKDSL